MVFECEEFELQDIAELKGGFAFKSEDYTDGGMFVLRTVNITDSGRITRDGATFISEEKAKEFDRFALKHHDTLFVMVGATLGKVGLVKEADLPALLNQNMWVIRGDEEKVNSLFLHYAFSEESKKMLGWASGAARDFVRREDYRKLKISLPPRKVQDKIASFIGSIDDKIDLNCRINQTLEAMAQAIFKSWFVDFDPVKAKIAAARQGCDPLRAAMSAISGKTDAELDALPREQYDQLTATAALFPDEMEESELGEIPRGWSVRTMPECIEVNPTRQLKKGAVAPYLDMANVPTNNLRAQNIVSREFTSGSKFRNGDTLLARITPCLENGKTAFVDFLDSDEIGWGSTEFIVLRPKGYLPTEFAYFLCRHPEFRAFAIGQMAGTSGRQRVPNDCFLNYMMVEPSKEVAGIFGDQVKGIMNQIKFQDEASKTLAILRDTLLPKLLSGELSIGALTNEEAEQVVETAGQDLVKEVS